MMDYPQFRASPAEALGLLASQSVARLVTVDADGWPRIGVHVFIHEGLDVEMHLLATDPQLDDIRLTGRAVIEVDEPLANASSDWVDAADVTHADQFFRCLVVRGAPVVLSDRSSVVDHLERMLARYQPGTNVSLGPVNPRYEGYYEKLRVVRVPARDVITKFKLGQRSDPAAVARIVEGLRTRATPMDLRTANLVEAANQSRLRVVR